MQSADLSGTVIVTGGASGLGAAVAEAARVAFDHGAVWTSVTGAALVVVAIVVSLRALRRA